MKKLLLFFTLFLTVFNTFSQTAPDWEFQLEGSVKQIFKHSFTGVPVVETSKYYYGINVVDQQPMWQLEKSAANEALKKVNNVASLAGVSTGTEELVKEAFQEIPFTPYVSINKALVNVASGKVIMGEGKHDYTNILGHDIVPELYTLLLKVLSADGNTKLYCIDLKSHEIVWDITLKENGLAGKMLNAVTDMSFASPTTPKATAHGDILYKEGKNLLLLDGKSGTTKWTSEVKPGYFFLNNKQDIVLVVQASSSMPGVTINSSNLSKKIMALDLSNGTELWKKAVKLESNFVKHRIVNDDEFMAIHKSGINIYNFKTGENKWKKDFEANYINDVSFTEKGYEVFYGNKIMLVNLEDGKEAWKKPLKLDMDEETEGYTIKKEYAKGLFIYSGGNVGLFDKETGKKIWRDRSISFESMIAFDDANNKVAILDRKKFYFFDPNAVEKKLESLKLEIEEPKEITGFEPTENGYFVTGNHEYVFMDKNGNVKYHQYFKQLKTDVLLKTALLSSNIIGGLLSTEVVVNDENGEEIARGGLFMSSQNAQALGAVSAAQYEVYRKLKKESKMRGLPIADKNTAYFLSGTKAESGDVLELVKINKNTGEENSRFVFGDDRKVIYMLDHETGTLLSSSDNTLKVFNLK
ncbi:PQQ-binding-like beta-propeller repeat protein [Limibacter armeniacum]|uniref:outer membrane protein assembly factor BamB family protein n=1 Tax=Limibacter armeniacum TaxID=466084 RepID=UPI002FE5EBBB